MSLFSVFGGSGFIGSGVVQLLRKNGHMVHVPKRNEINQKENLGIVIYAIGITGDFRIKPFETIEAHVDVLSKILKKCKFEKFIYLSSTRVYANNQITKEDSALALNPLSCDELYNISKVMGESICLSTKQNTVVARLSNVAGFSASPNSFLGSIMREAIATGSISLMSNIDSSKDFICLEDVAMLLEKISNSNLHRVYNIASGKNISVGSIVNKLAETDKINIRFKGSADRITFPEIATERIRVEFGFKPAKILDMLPKYYLRLKKENNENSN